MNKLGNLKRAVDEFSTKVPGKSYEQFIAERTCIIALLQEAEEEAVKHDLH